MQLSFAQKRQLLHEGYVKIPGAVPDLMIKEAMKAINYTIGKGIPSDFRGATYCEELASDPVITDLFNKTPVKTIVDSLIGETDYNEIRSAQIALRFPDYVDEVPDDAGAHMDGLIRVKDGIEQTFTALVGIILSNQSEQGCGNFTVYPGTHRVYEAYFREHGAQALFDDPGFANQHRSEHVQLPKPVQITGNPGDAILTHFQLIHAGGINLSDRIRSSCYFRVDHKARKDDWQGALTDQWRHWPGMVDYRLALN